MTNEELSKRLDSLENGRKGVRWEFNVPSLITILLAALTVAFGGYGSFIRLEESQKTQAAHTEDLIRAIADRTSNQDTRIGKVESFIDQSRANGDRLVRLETKMDILIQKGKTQ